MTATHGVGTYGNAVGTVTPLDHKMAQLGHVVKTAANTIRPGIFWDGNLTIVSGKANMSYDIRALAAVLSRGATAGAVLLTNDSVYNALTTAAPGSNSRYDVVYLWQREYSLDGTDSNPVIGVIQGTPAASPTVPSLAAFPGAIALAQILVPAGVTATNTGTTITQTGPFTALDGGVVVARNGVERDAYVPAAADTKALCWVASASAITYRWNGSAWKQWESDWITYSPALTNITLGTGGTSSFMYKYVAGDVRVRGGVVLGSSGFAVSGIPTLALPVPRAALVHNFEGVTGMLVMSDLSDTSRPYDGSIKADTASVTAVRLVPSNSGSVTTAIGATVPFTWAAGDAFSLDFTYQKA